ncbi:MAG TPA: hypothetical protein VMK82_00220 [Steroidobacteraceae bacterium]|nr:hypothetical protein [Steroidobacteraceae bacterium]
MSASPGQAAGDPSREAIADLLAEHARGYAALVGALVKGWQRSVQRRLLGTLLAVAGLLIFTLVLSLGSVAAAWDTGHRWTVLLSVAGLYLLLGCYGLWLMLHRTAGPDPADLLMAELGNDARLLASAVRGRAP